MQPLVHFVEFLYMLKVQRGGQKPKVARTSPPHTTEFKPYVEARADQAQSKLIDEASAVFGSAVDKNSQHARTGLRPDDLYEASLAEKGLQKRWEAAFGGEESGRRMFGLVAWIYFFEHGDHWLGRPSDRAGLGKRGWTYVAEPEPEEPAAAPVVPSPPRFGRHISMQPPAAAAAAAAGVSPAPQVVAEYKFRLHQMVFVRGQGGKFGTIPREITGLPDQEPNRDPDDPRYEVSIPKRFGPNIGEWIVERDLRAQV